MNDEKFKKLLDKIQDLKKSGNFDLSLEEDLSIAIMNLISLEEHFFFTAERTQKSEYFDLMNEIRAIRKSLLERMIDKHEGETWCVAKHLLAASIRLIEVGTKYLSDNKQKDAQDVFAQAYRVYSLFWALRLKLIDTKDLKKISDGKLNIHDKEGEQGKPWTAEDIVNKLVDCCDES